MTLNASGPLSIGGSTVGQSINLELGLSATAQSSLNDSALRTLAGVASGQISISNFYGKSNDRYFISYIVQSGRGVSVVINRYEDFNIIVGGQDAFQTSGGNNNAGLYKYSRAGALTFQDVIKASSTVSDFSENITGVGADRYTNYYSALYGSAVSGIVTSKYDSSGVVQWQRKYGNSSTISGRMCVYIDNNNDPFPVVVGYTTQYSGGTRTDGVILRYDGSGALNIQRVLTYNTGTSYTSLQAVDYYGQGNPTYYFSGRTASGGNLVLLAGLVDSAGNISWVRTLDGVAHSTNIGDSDCSTIPSGNGAYFVSKLSLTTGGVLCKFNVSGTLLWQRSFNVDIQACAADESDFGVYICGAVGVNPTYGFIAKVDTNGTLVWQRIIRFTSGGYVKFIGIDYEFANGSKFLALTGEITTGGSGGICAVKIPADGSLTGTYGSFVYEASSYTMSTSTYTVSTPALVTVATALTNNTNSSFVGATSFTPTTQFL